MKRIVFLFLFIFILSFKFGTVYGYKIVVLGSSTAAGSGPKDISNAWVNRYRTFVQSINPLNTVVNLAVGGYTTYHIMPTGNKTPNGRYYPDTIRNITKALSLNPQAIIINMPTNDIANGYSTIEYMSNFAVIVALASQANIPVWITTSQPRNLATNLRDSLILIKSKINDTYQEKAIDFWTTIANPDGTINKLYDSGDGIHLNDNGHAILFQRVVNAHILDITSDRNDNADTLYPTIFVSSKGSNVTLSFDMNRIADSKFAIYNLLGQQIYNTSFKTSNIGFNLIQTTIKDPGVYFAILSYGKTNVAVKFVK